MIKSNSNDYKLSSELLKSISMLNFKDFTRVQKQVIPAVLEQKDIVVKSPTGSGKTAAFAIPNNSRKFASLKLSYIRFF